MKVVAYAVAGLLVGAGLTSSACYCSQPSAPDGSYELAPWDSQTQEKDLRVVVDDDKVTETFTRDGKKYVIRYQVVETVEYGNSGSTLKSRSQPGK